MTETYNYLAIIVSAIVSYIIGLLWFTMLFREAYIQDLGKTKAQMSKGASMLVASVLQIAGNIAMAWILSWLLQKTGSVTVGDSICLSLLVSLGFVIAVIGPMYAFQAFSLRLFAIITGGYTIMIIVTGIIVTVWR